MKKLIVILVSFLWINSFAKNDTINEYFIIQQQKINELNQKLFHSKKISDEEKNILNTQLLSIVEETLNKPESFDFGFDSLKKDIGILTSPDNTFRFFHWNIPLSDGTFKYYGFIQKKMLPKSQKNKSGSMLLFPLIDRSNEIKSAELHIGDNKKWYGMLYYKIIPLKTKSKTYYTLLGWDGNDKISQKKFIDILYFDNNGIPKFGADIFEIPRKNPKRIAFEYAHNCAFVLRYNEQMEMIVFDRLGPMEPQLAGQFQYYCTTDFEYDGFKIQKGKWLFVSGVQPRNDKTVNDNLYKNPKDTKNKPESNVLIDKKKKKK